MLTRAISGAVFVAAIVLSILFNQWIAIGLFTLFFILSVLEFKHIINIHPLVELNNPSFLMMCFSSYALALLSIYLHNYINQLLVLPAIFCMIILFMLTEIKRKRQEAIFNVAVGILGFFYIVIPFTLISYFLFTFDYNNLYLLGMFLLIWTNDTFAYLTGKILGKTKLIEYISPKKTWEGTIGGIVFTILVSLVLPFLIGSWQFWIVAAFICSICAIVGDLFESLIKRNLKIKDSGTIMPGHGGVLDRFDATLVAVPFFFTWLIIYLKYIQ